MTKLNEQFKFPLDIHKLLHLRQELSSNLKGGGHLFPDENHGFRSEDADPNSNHFALSYELPWCMQYVKVGGS